MKRYEPKKTGDADEDIKLQCGEVSKRTKAYN